MTAPQVRTTSLVVVDDEGRPRVVVGCIDAFFDLWGLAVVDAAGVPSVVIAGSEHEAQVSITHEGREVVKLAKWDGDPSITVVSPYSRKPVYLVDDRTHWHAADRKRQ